MAQTVGTPTGFDYLIRDVGQEVMPIESGWNEVLLYDKLLQSPEFSIEEVVKATLKILGDRIKEEIENSSDDSIPILYRADLEKQNGKKRIVLFSTHGHKVAFSPFEPLFKAINFRYKKIEYVQEGSLGTVYYRNL